jgi:hypothetical protein
MPFAARTYTEPQPRQWTDLPSPTATAPAYTRKTIAQRSTRDLEHGGRQRLWELMRYDEVFRRGTTPTISWSYDCQVWNCRQVQHGFSQRYQACLAVIEHRADVHSLPAGCDTPQQSVAALSGLQPT